ncbi:MAG TPA: tetratricopeptide repeat protein [Pyrinomonadaceae bacterium]|nr:tetratricopeptide repeat protein [Pyrinomonadaceae bacterium]
MKDYAMVRLILVVAALGLGLMMFGAPVALGQAVGADVGGGAGIFRPKNPETKKRTAKPATPVTKPSTSSRTGARVTRPTPAANDDRVEELLDKGNELRDARRFAEAQEAYQGVLKLRPRDARAAYGLGNVFTDQQRWDDAETSYRDAVQWNPQGVDALVALSVVLVQPRTGAGNAKRLADAEAFARKSVQIDPKNAVGWDRLGVAMETRGSYTPELEHSYRRAIELDPEFAVGYAHLARVLKRSGKQAEATPLYDKAFELAKDPPTLNLIAESMQNEQLWEKSGPVLRRSLELDARNPTSLMLMGRMLLVLKRYDEAEPYLKTATEVSPRAFQPFNLLGRSYLALGRLPDAERAYERAAEFAPVGDRKQIAGTFGFAGIGDEYMKAKEKANAERAYLRALELDPGNQELQQKLSQARSR